MDVSLRICGSRRWIAFAACLAALTQGAIARQSDAPLQAGLVIERPLKSGEVHEFAVDLSAGDYFAITVDQRGIDVRPAILDPDGKTVYEYDFGEWGDEPAAIVAATGGRYRLRIGTESGSPPAGTYRLRVDALHPATAPERIRAQAMRMQVDALPLIRSAHTDFPKGREEYGRILALWESIGDGFGVAHALTALRFLTNQQDDWAATDAYGRREVEAYRAIGHDYGEARALRSRAISLRLTGDVDQACEALERALALHRAAGRTSAATLVLSDLANARGTAGDFAQALDNIYAAIAMAHASGLTQVEARSWSVAGLAHQTLREHEIAADAFRRVRTLVPPADPLQAEAALRLGTVLLDLGEPDEAARLLGEALTEYARRGWRAQQSQALIGLGNVAARTGHLETARDYFTQALARASEVPFPAAQVLARRRLAEVLLQAGEVAAAQLALDAARLEQIPDPNERAMFVAVQARAALARHDLAGARTLAAQALELCESVRGRSQSTRIDAGTMALTQAVYQTAVHVLMASHDAEPLSGYSARAFEVSERARARSLLDVVTSSGTRADEHGGTWQELRDVQRTLNAKALALDSAPAGTTRRPALAAAVDTLTARAAVLEGQLRREQPALGAIAASALVSLDALQHQVLDDGTVLVEYLLGNPSSYAWVISRDGLKSYRLAPKGEIEDAVRRQRSIAVAPGAAQKSPRLASGTALARLLLGPIRDIPPGRRIVVVAPGLLQDVPFAALPIDAAGRDPLIARNEIVHAPSASVLFAMRTGDAIRPAGRRTIAVFADPVFDASDPRVAVRQPAVPAEPTTAEPTALRRALRAGVEGGKLVRLPFTRLEAERIASVVPAGQLFEATGFDATIDAVRKRALNDVSIVHFATHGVLNTRTPELSGLVLSLVDRRGHAQDGFLRLNEIENLHLRADLVVLSGCETARGRRVDGEGTIGLTHGFIGAGARQVVASLWRVDDLATAELMQAFYTNLLQRHQTPAAALRAAQRQLAASARWADPYYWAGFIVQGDWR